MNLLVSLAISISIALVARLSVKKSNCQFGELSFHGGFFKQA